MNEDTHASPAGAAGADATGATDATGVAGATGATADPDDARPGLWGRLREKWGVGPWGVLAILLAFSLAGMSVLKISRPLLNFLLPPDAPKWLWWTLRIVVIVPIYEVLLLTYGTLLGQRRFFWPKLKRTATFVAKPFRRR